MTYDKEDYIPLLAEESEDGCFLCQPEPWRTIYTGNSVQVVVGLGPLCPGYLMVAPKQHCNTAAQLAEIDWREFVAVNQIVVDSLERHYGFGYTAYEHGQLGACLSREAAGDLTTHCHHCHRVFIPGATDCADAIKRHFQNVHQLDTPNDLRSLCESPYIFYETGSHGVARIRLAFTEGQGLVSQFMRRILQPILFNQRHYSWNVDRNYLEMIATVSRLRGEFLGLDAIDDAAFRPQKEVLDRVVCLDGLRCVGKTTLARALAGIYRVPMIDTGLVFRLVAKADVDGAPRPTVSQLTTLLLESIDDASLRSFAVNRRIAAYTEDESVRALYRSVLTSLTASLGFCIVTGRDSSRVLAGNCLSILVESDGRTRAQRFVLSQSCNNGRLLTVSEAMHELRQHDSTELARLPQNDSVVIRLDNGRRSFQSTLNEVRSFIGSCQ